MVSIITAVYNAEKYISECINSICNQDYADIEIILIDDGSMDKSGAICDEYSKKDTRIKVIHEQNGGVSHARNVGLKEAKGQYIMFVDADDYVSPQYVSYMVDLLENNKGADLALCRFYNNVEQQDGTYQLTPCVSHAEKNILSGQDIILRRFDRMKTYYVVPWNKIYKKELFDHVKYPEGRICEDAWISLDIYQLCNKVICTNELLYYYRNRVGTISSSSSVDWIKAQLDWLEREIEYFIKYGNPENVIDPAKIYVSMIVKSYHKYVEIHEYTQHLDWSIAINSLINNKMISKKCKFKYLLYKTYVSIF